MDVAIISYNQEKFIAETLDSALNQTYENINQIIIADDGSDDLTPDIIKQYAAKYPIIKPVLAKKNKGIAHNFNRALKAVNGEFLCIMGGDDLMLPEKIETQIAYFNNNPDIVVCSHDMDVFNSSTGKSLGKFSETISFKKPYAKMGVESLFDPALCQCPSSFMYKTMILPKTGFDTRLKYLNDFLFDVDVLMKGDIGFIDTVLGKYRIHESNVSSSEDADRIGLEEMLIAYTIITVKYPELFPLVKKRKTALYFSKVMKNIMEGNDEKAKHLSKILMSEGNFFRGFIAYLLSNLLKKETAIRLSENKKLEKMFMKKI